MSLKGLRKGFVPTLKVLKIGAIVLKNLHIGHPTSAIRPYVLLNFKESFNSCIHQKREK